MTDFVKANLVIPQGGLFEVPINVLENGNAKDLSGCHARMQIREHKDSATTIAEYTDQAGTILINPAGQVVVRVTGDVTATYDFGDAWYDIELLDPDDGPIRLAAGRISLSREITR